MRVTSELGNLVLTLMKDKDDQARTGKKGIIKIENKILAKAQTLELCYPRE